MKPEEEQRTVLATYYSAVNFTRWLRLKWLLITNSIALTLLDRIWFNLRERFLFVITTSRIT